VGKLTRKYKTEYRDPGEVYSGDMPARGIYNGRLVRLSDHTSGSGNDGLEWVFEITDEPYAGWQGYTYTNDDAAAWKEAGILVAGGIVSADKLDSKGNLTVDLNTTHEKIVKDFGPVRLQVRHETWDEEKRAKLGRVLPPDEETDKSGKKAKKKKKAKDEPF
jgi:hypothetical protein